jgi:actin-binding protein anillin
MRISRKLAVSVEHHGFLTIFEDISNLGFWHRRWCWLKDAKLHYWVHPEDENKKNPVGHLDLEGNLEIFLFVSNFHPIIFNLMHEYIYL